MPTNSYELSFELPTLSEETEDLVAAEFDSVIAVHAGVTTVTLTADGDDCLSAAIAAMKSLGNLGVLPIRLVDDVVSRSEIARRMNVTRQSVGQWIRGERHAEAPFPNPYILTDGGLWLWGEVVEALSARGEGVEDMNYPSRQDIQLIGGALAAYAIAIGSGWTWRSQTTVNNLMVSPGRSIQQTAPVESASFDLVA